MGLRLFDFKKFIPVITGRDKFLKTTAEPEKMVERLLNLILTSSCPTVSIVEFELAPFAESKLDGNNCPTCPPKLSIKNCSLIMTPDGIRAPVSMSNFVLTKSLPAESMSVDIPNKQKPVKNTRLFGLFHASDPSLSRDNSRVVKVIVDDLITGLGPSFYTAKT